MFSWLALLLVWFDNVLKLIIKERFINSPVNLTDTVFIYIIFIFRSFIFGFLYRKIKSFFIYSWEFQTLFMLTLYYLLLIYFPWCYINRKIHSIFGPLSILRIFRVWKVSLSFVRINLQIQRHRLVLMRRHWLSLVLLMPNSFL